MRVFNIALILSFVTGCAIAPHQAEVGGVPAKETLESAFATVRSGHKTSVAAEGWVVEWAGEGRIRLLPENPKSLGGEASDAAITHKLKDELASLGVHVHTDAGVVTLRGNLDSQADAVRAIRTALREKGVTAVNTELSFPVNQASRR